MCGGDYRIWYLFYVGGEVGKIKAILFLAGFALVFVLLMKFSLH